MRKPVWSLLLIIAVIGLFAFSGFTQDKSFEYIGVKKCKMCHSSKKSGEQYKIWEGTAHSKAYETLASDEAKAVGKKMGIDDPQQSEKCLKCHVTGKDEKSPTYASSFKMDEGVGCEACHGPGSEYKSMKVMKGVYAGEMEGQEYGLVMPSQEKCKTCHNENSPTFKGFDWDKYWAKIAHPVPKGD